MACFDNIVALKELCTDTEPFSGIYLNDVGITKAFITSILTSDYETIQEFVDSKVNHAIRIMKNAIHAKYGNRVNSSSLISDARLGFTQKNLVSIAGGNFRGIHLTLNNSSNYINFNLSSLSLQINTTGTVNILVYDVYQDKLLYTIPVSAVAGEIVTVNPHKIIASDGNPLNLFIGYDATGISSITTHLRDNQCCGVSSCTTSFLKAQGVTNSAGVFKDENFSSINHTSGLSLVYSLNCDSFAWMCAYAQPLALPIAYKAAAEMYDHASKNALNFRSSNNVNLNMEQIKQIQEKYEFMFREQLDSLLHNMNLPQDSICFQCKTPSRSAVILP